MPTTIKPRATGKKSKAFLEAIDFAQVKNTCDAFAAHIKSHRLEVMKILSRYETHEVVQDEISRTLDLLLHIEENRKYFVLRIGDVTSFLPRNQPLYALTCFVLVPSLMASGVHFRIPDGMKELLPDLLSALDANMFFPNIQVSAKRRIDFLAERSALCFDPNSSDHRSLTDAVIFTGTSQHAEGLRRVFSRKTLFIANGSGHNPIVVGEDANIERAVEATLSLTLYNQGQDCAAPNAILVRSEVYETFLDSLRAELSAVKFGPYHDASCRVGPVSNADDLVRIQEVLAKNRIWLDRTTPGHIHTSMQMVEPTIICKPLKEGGNYTELFAPILFVQRYEKDGDLGSYFEHPHYARNAMYVTLYGSSPYVQGLVGRSIEGHVLHAEETLLRNTHLHAPGVERGTEPYGGYGLTGSTVSMHGKVEHKPTLPQRDLFEWIVKPLLDPELRANRERLQTKATDIRQRNVSKLLRLKETTSETPQVLGTYYIDSEELAHDRCRYLRVPAESTYHLLEHPNSTYIASLEPTAVEHVRALHRCLKEHEGIPLDEFTNWLYDIPKTSDAAKKVNRAAQSTFFVHLYQLLLGRESGPRLPQFLLDVDRKRACELLDVWGGKAVVFIEKDTQA